MIRRQTKFVMTTALLAWAIASRVGAVETSAQDRNYRVIVDRNPFGLKPPPPPPTNTVVDIKPKDEILLTGITSIGEARAYFMTKAPQGKNPDFYTLKVNDKQGALEVLDIDINNKSVRIRNAGVETIMTFASHGVKAPATPAATAPPMPGSTPAGGVAGVHIPGATSLPGGPTGSLPNMASPSGSPTVAPGPVASSGRIRTIPARNPRTPVGLPGGDAMAQPAAPDPDAAARDVLLMELQRRTSPGVPLPPTPGLPQ